MYTLSCQITGVAKISLRVFGHTEFLGLVSNSQSFLPERPAYERPQPSPSPTTTCAAPPAVATAGDDHCPSRILSPTLFTCQASLPVFLSTAIMEGARGAGTRWRFSSWPLDVPAITRSPKETGDEFAWLRGDTPSSLIMSNFHTTFALPLPSPCVSRQTNSQRLVT